MKRICVGFFGFIRNPITYRVFNRFRKLLPEHCTIDIFICCPNKVNEYDADTDIIDKDSEIFNEMREELDGYNFYIDVYEYNPLVFIKRVRELSLPDYTEYPTYRVFSQHFSISRLCKNISNISRQSHINYDSIILTRFDTIPGVKTLGSLVEQVNENTIHIWRRCPYISDIDAEDRIIISSIGGVHALSHLYDDGFTRNPRIYEALIPENILGKFLLTCNTLRLLPQEGILLEHSSSLQVKYSDKAKNYLNELIDKYKDELSIEVINQ